MPDNTIVLTFPEYEQPGQRLAEELNIDHKMVGVHHFPDGESRVRVPTPLPEHVIFCRSLNHPNEKLVELIFAISAARKHGAKNITLVSPYLCYMRQDMEFNPGDAVSQHILGELLSHYVDTLITVDPHLHRTNKLEDSIPVKNAIALNAYSLTGAFINQQADNPILIGPDNESEQWVSAIAKPLNLEYIIAKKKRRGDLSVSIELPDYSYSGRDIVIVDDIISTGCTMVEVAKSLSKEGVKEINAFVTHALFSDKVGQFVKNSDIQNIWSTDSIIHTSNTVFLAPLLARGILEQGVLEAR